MTNPFFEPSVLPFSMPPFAQIRDEHYRPAFEKGMADHLAEIQNITGNDDLPSFENTMVPLETGGQLLERVATVFFNKASADSSPFTDELEEEIAPLLAAHAAIIKFVCFHSSMPDLNRRASSFNVSCLALVLSFLPCSKSFIWFW